MYIELPGLGLLFRAKEVRVLEYQIWLKFRNSISNNVVGSLRLIISQIFNIGAWLFLYNLIPLSLRIVRFPICKKNPTLVCINEEEFPTKKQQQRNK